MKNNYFKGQTAKRPTFCNINNVKLIVYTACFAFFMFFSQSLHSQNDDPESWITYVLPYDLFGNGDDYDFNQQSSLQDNYLFRWPIPFVPGEVNLKVRIHYINVNSNSVPTQIITTAKQNALDIFAERDINLIFQSDRIYHSQDWEPLNPPLGIDLLHNEFFTNNPPATPFETDEIHIAIFDKDYLAHPSNNKMPRHEPSNPPSAPFYNIVALYPRVNVYWVRIPTRNISVAYPNINVVGGQSYDYYGPFDEEKIIKASIVGGLGSSLGLIPLNLSASIGANNLSTTIPTETNLNCHEAGDFLCDTKPFNGVNSNSFDPNGCSFSHSAGSLAQPGRNIMAYHGTQYGCIDNLTEEQARKIRYVLSNDLDMHGCLTGGSSLLLDNFEITPLRTVITQNTTWTKPAALHILEVEDGAVFTTESSIDFAPGNMLSINPVFGYEIERWADYSNGYNQEIMFDHETKDDVHNAFSRVSAMSRLNVYGGSLNNYFSHWPWQGVTAVGDRAQPQNQSHQAVVHFQDATVRMAHEAVYPNDREKNGMYYNGPRIGSTTGSYVKAFDTDFINCRRVIGFRKYANMRTVGSNPRELNNLSHFTHCKVIHNDEYRFKSMPLGITMHQVKGIRIRGCEFENTRSNSKNRGDAIVSISSQFTLDEYCLDASCFSKTPSKISGYERGIHARLNHPSNDATKITNTEFLNNYYASYIEANHFFDFTDNEIHIPNGVRLHWPFNSLRAYGLYVKSSTGFTLEGNHFKKSSSVPGYIPVNVVLDPVGLVVNSTYTEGDAAYRNTFEEMALGIDILGQNHTTDNDGFQIRCNEFIDGPYDIYVPPGLSMWPSIITNTVGTYQGFAGPNSEPKDLANNLFSHINSDPNVYSDFNNEGDPLWVYYYWPDEPSEPRYEPIYINRVYSVPEDVGQEEKCPEGGYSPPEITFPDPIHFSTVYDLRADYYNDFELLGQLIDNGNTPQLLADIFSYPESEYYDMFLDLMEQSPYLSEEALIDVINLPNFPDVLLRNLLMENPQSVTNENVSNAILERVPALPQYMLDDIFDGTDLYGPREILESQVAHKKRLFKQYAFGLTKAIAHEMANDEEQAWLTDSLFKMLDVINTPQSMMMKGAFMQYYDMTGYEAAYQTAKSLPGDTNEVYYEEVSGMVDLLEAYYNTDDSLSSYDLQTVEDWRNSDYPSAQSMAYGILKEFNIATDSILIDPIVLPSPPSKSKRVAHKDVKKAKPNRMKLYPNPARDYTVLNYELKGTDRALHYRMMDASGKVIFQNSFEAKVKGDEIIPIPEVANGIYILVIEEASGELLESIRLNVMK